MVEQCSAAAVWAAAELGTAPLRIVWVRPGDPNLDWIVTADGSDHWHEVIAPEGVAIRGWVRRSRPDAIYIVDQAGCAPEAKWAMAAPMIVLHEARHCFQHLSGMAGTREELERDALNWGKPAFLRWWRESR